jgi:methylase of polypeptide subunit release factors
MIAYMQNSPISESHPYVNWLENDVDQTAIWRSEAHVALPKRVMVVDDTLKADRAYQLTSEGTFLLWRGDFQNAKQLLQALARRIDHKPHKAKARPTEPAAAFHLHRQAQSHRARILGMLLVAFEPHHVLNLRRAPIFADACHAVYGESNQPYIVSLREILGLIGAYEWRKKGVEIAALNAKIHPYYGVFSPVRGEYLSLVQQAPLPTTELAFDIGTGTGVLSAILALRGVKHIIATDQDPRALACATENIMRLNLAARVTVVKANLFPEGKAALIVCNPPWIPARPSSSIENAIYDPDSQMLKGFLNGVGDHLNENGEAWLILSDIAEHLGLRSRVQLLQWIADAKLALIEKHDIKPHHPKVADADDPLHQARAAEVTSLWRFKHAV